MKLLRYSLLVCLAALAGLSSSVGVRDSALAQDLPECTVTVKPGESIQEAIYAVPSDSVICLTEGGRHENIKIEKSLTLLGKGAKRTVLDGVKKGYPVVGITHGTGLMCLTDRCVCRDIKLGGEATNAEQSATKSPTARAREDHDSQAL